MAQQEYNPTDAQPYQPVAAPPTPDAKPSPVEGQQPFQFQGHGNISHMGAAAGVLDNIMKGYLNGHAAAEAHKALTAKKKADGLTASYNADALRLTQLKAAGVEESTPEYQAAKTAVDGSWGALHDYAGSLIDQQSGGKKGSKGSSGGQQRSPAEILSDPKSTSQDKAKVYWEIQGKLGAPVYHQIAAYNTPQAQQQRATATTQGQAAGMHASNAMAHEQATATYNKYAGKSDEEMAALPKEERDAFENAKGVLMPPTDKGTRKLYAAPDGKTKEWYLPGQEPKDWNAVAPGATPHNVRAWKKNADGKFTSVMLDPTTNQEVPGSENRELAPPSSLSGHISTGFYHYVDSDGQLHQIAETKTTMPMAANEGGHTVSTPRTNPPTVVTQSYRGKTIPGLVAKGNVDVANRPNIDNGDGTHSSVFSMSFNVDGKEVLVPGVGDGTTYPLRKLTKDEALEQFRKTGKNLGTFKDEKAANAYAETLHEDQAKHGKTPTPEGTTRRERVRASAQTTASASGVPTGTPGDRILGHKGTPDEAAARKNADTLEVAARNSLERMKNPTAIGDTGIVFNWVRAQVAGAGRMTNTEIQQAVQSGSMGTKFKNAYDRATTGKLDPQFRREMVQDTLMSARTARQQANSYKSVAVPSGPSKGLVSVDDAMKLQKYKGKSRDEVSKAILAQGYTPQ